MNGCQQLSIVCLCLVLCTYSLAVSAKALSDEDFYEMLLDADTNGYAAEEKRAIPTRSQAIREYCLLKGKFNIRCRQLIAQLRAQPTQQPFRVITFRS